MKMQDVELRDYFAGQALATLGSHEVLLAMHDEAIKKGKKDSEVVAAWCIEIADAMLAERAKVQCEGAKQYRAANRRSEKRRRAGHRPATHDLCATLNDGWRQTV